MKYDRMSIDNRVGFIEKWHRYVLLEDKNFRFKSVTKIAGEYGEPFNADEVAKKVSRIPKSKYYGMSIEAIKKMWTDASKRGTVLHDIGEKLLKGEIVEEYPDDEAVKYLIEAVTEIKNRGYKVAGTEVLFYNDEVGVAGLSDIILTRDGKFMIYDFKFIDELKKKSYYDPSIRSFRKMKKPFKYLHDCNWIHYSIQLSLYEDLSNSADLIEEKVLVVIGKDGYSFEPIYPMRVFFDEKGELQAIYETWGGKWYDSRIDKLVKYRPKL